jgi:amidase
VVRDWFEPAAEIEIESARGLLASGDDPITRGIGSVISATMRQFTAVMTSRDHFITDLERFFDDYEVLLCPVTVGAAIPHCFPGTPVSVDDSSVTYLMGGVAYTAPFNLTGNPAAVLPVGRSADGLPLGVQVVGRRWDDMRVLAIAEAIDRFQPPVRLP